MKSYSFLTDILLLLLVTITGFLLWDSSQYSSNNSIDTEKDNTPDQKQQNHYDAFATGIVGTQHNEKGQKKYKLSAPALKHYKSQDLTLIEQPELYIYNKGEFPWVVTANQAKAINGLKEITLLKNIQISGIQTQDYKGSILKSSEIHYYPNKNQAITYKPVTIQQPGLLLNATGMEILFDKSNIKLLSQVKGQYDPQTKSK